MLDSAIGFAQMMSLYHNGYGHRRRTWGGQIAFSSSISSGELDTERYIAGEMFV